MALSSNKQNTSTLKSDALKIRKLAIEKIKFYTQKIEELDFTHKTGLEMEFMAFAKPGYPNAEKLNVKKIQSLLRQKFPGKIERFYKEWPLGVTEQQKGFDFPGVRKYEVTFRPSSPLEVCDLIYKVRNYLKSLEQELHVTLDFSSKPIKNEDVPGYVEKARARRFPGHHEGFVDKNIVFQGTGNGVQFNFSLWNGNQNAFFDKATCDGTKLFYRAAYGLLKATSESILPFVAGQDAFLRLTPEDTKTAAPGACKIAEWKGGELGKGIIRPSPYPDSIIGDSKTEEKRSNKGFRMETRHNDPMQDQYVCMAAVLGSLYYGTKNSRWSIKDIKEINTPFETSMTEAIESFEKSTIWPRILGNDLYVAVLNNAQKKYANTLPAVNPPLLFSMGILRRSERLSELAQYSHVTEIPNMQNARRQTLR